MIYILVAWYSDCSGVTIVGAYENEDEANDRLAVAQAAMSAKEMRVIPMRLGVCNPVEVF